MHTVQLFMSVYLHVQIDLDACDKHMWRITENPKYLQLELMLVKNGIDVWYLPFESVGINTPFNTKQWALLSSTYDWDPNIPFPMSPILILSCQ